MILFHNAAMFIHAFNHRLGSLRRDLEELRAEKFSPRFQRNGSDGQSRSLHRYRVRELDHGRDGWLHVVGSMKSDHISAFVY
jgi:hypothetical protein